VYTNRVQEYYLLVQHEMSLSQRRLAEFTAGELRQLAPRRPIILLPLVDRSADIGTRLASRVAGWDA
jgi:hypothetical protein